MPFFGVPIRNGLPIGLGSVAGFGVQQFDPSLLFEGGTVPGAWYDPSDLSTMFDTSAGTTPVAMPGQGSAVSVGLMLDKSQGLVLGSELITPAANQDFSSNTGYWTPQDGSITISGGAANFSSTTNTFALYAAVSAISASLGKYYEITYTLVSCSAGAIRFGIGANYTTSRSTPGTYTERITAGAGGFFGFYAVGTTTASVDNVSVKQVLGNHAISFNNTTARPELRARVNRLERTEEISNAYWTKTQLASFAASGVTPNGVTAFNLVPNTNVDSHRLSRSAINIAGPKTMRVVAKANGYNFLSITDLTTFSAGIDLTTGTQWGGAGTAVITSLGNGWWEIKVSGTATASTSFAVEPLSSASFLAYAGDGVSGVLVGEFDDRFSNIGANVPAYQRIADALTYDTSGFPLYLLFEGAVGQRGMYTPASIPFATVTSDGQARRNLLSFPTAFNDAFWLTNAQLQPFGSGSVANTTATTDPIGGNNADLITEITGAITNASLGNASSISASSGINYTASIYAKAAGRRYCALFANGVPSNAGAYFDLQDGVVTATGANNLARSITPVGSGWFRLTITFATTTAAAGFSVTLSADGTTNSYTGNGSGVYIWGAQLELGSTATAFQNIGTDKVAVFAGVRKLSDAAAAILTELSADRNANNGAWTALAPGNVATPERYAFNSKGTLSVAAITSAATYTAPVTNVFTGIGDISGDSAILRANGTQVGSNTGDQGTGNFGTYPLFIGARNNASSWLNGQLYSLIIAGSAVSAGNISATESWVAGRTGIAI